MHKEITAQAKQKKDEREEVLKEIRQLENRDRKSTRLNSSHGAKSRMPSSA